MRAREQVQDRQQHYGAQDRDQKSRPVPSNHQHVPGDQQGEPSSKNGANDSDNNITHAAHTGAVSSKQTGNPACERSEDQPREPTSI